jgi:hypothetical protein
MALVVLRMTTTIDCLDHLEKRKAEPSESGKIHSLLHTLSSRVKTLLAACVGLYQLLLFLVGDIL